MFIMGENTIKQMNTSTVREAEVSKQVLNVELPYDSAILLLGEFYPGEMKTSLQLGLHANVHSIHNDQKVETTQMPISWRMDKQNVYTWNGMLFALKKEEVLMLSLSSRDVTTSLISFPLFRGSLGGPVSTVTRLYSDLRFSVDVCTVSVLILVC